jgi:menaquinol-cytochrome c reductase iron-sulfur subunit
MTENRTDKNWQGSTENRRRFLIRLSLGLSALSALVAGIPVISALLAPLLKKSPEAWRKVADLNEFAVGAVKLVTFENADPEAWAGITARSAAWLRRDSESAFTAFSANCTHLGCPVRWEEGAQLFMCPCHGGVYYKDGTVASGPPPKALVQYPVRINKQQIEIQTAPVPITTL